MGLRQGGAGKGRAVRGGVEQGMAEQAGGGQADGDTRTGTAPFSLMFRHLQVWHSVVPFGGGAVQFRTRSPAPGTGTEGVGGGAIAIPVLGAFLNAPFHSADQESPQLRGGTIPFLALHMQLRIQSASTVGQKRNYYALPHSRSTLYGTMPRARSPIGKNAVPIGVRWGVWRRGVGLGPTRVQPPVRRPSLQPNDYRNRAAIPCPDI